MVDQLTYKRFGNRAILIEWPNRIDELILADILQFKALIISNKKDDIEECVSAYNSLTVIYHNEIIDFPTEKQSLTSLYQLDSPQQAENNFLWKIPVCYDTEFGIDLEEMSSTLNLSTREIIDLHSQAIYTVYFIGFLPGFLYLGGLNEQLETRRKSTPRLQVNKGSVAIGGSQTGIYPNDSAGGWNIIGKTPLSFFDPDNAPPCFAKAGDKIQFVPISHQEFKQIEIETKLDLYTPSKQNWNG